MKKQFTFGMAPALAVALSSAASADLIYDNGDPDGDSGFSNIFNRDLGLDRRIADDFILVGGPGWLVNNVEMNYLWNTIGSGGATDFLIQFFADDANGGPGTVISEQVSSEFTETLTGNILFNRPEVIFSIDIAPVTLAADTNYWISIQPNGVENGFQLSSHSPFVNGDEAYVFYRDAGHTDWVSTGDFFDEPSDMSFRLNGEVVPAPGGLALLGFASLVGVRRRRGA